MEGNYLWNEDKNALLLRERGLSFEMVVEAVANGDLLADEPHPDAIKYPNQRLLFVIIGDYVCVAPYVLDGSTRFLKTLYRSRKANRRNTGEDDGTS
jgi:uncharacterized DUF497 family protein